MALASGTRFGSYEVGEALGAGGMGEVYRATDTTLERDVALKVLPASFADDADRVTRFEREARTLAALNHPNIAQIYGLEKSDGTTALVMELVDGTTLEERIAKGPIPADEALGIAMQIADALEAAHGQNIVHRDLKPANIKLKQDGTVKVLDFGIAKALAPESLTSEPQSPIMTTPATQVGVILGTAAYMSPEQAKGKAIDQRTDIWAFGCVLYEMLTGQLAFGAEDIPTTLARIIANDTNLDSLPVAISPAVRKTIEVCLEKDVRKRVADIRDVKLGLDGTFVPEAMQSSASLAAPQPLWRRVLPVSAALIVGGLLVGIASWSLRSTSEPQPVNRFYHELAESQSFRFPGEPVIALSPAGRYFAYNTNEGVYLRAMDELEARLVPGTERMFGTPTFSPDGQSLAFWGEGPRLSRIGVGGGAPVLIAELTGAVRGLSWEKDGTILGGGANGIFRVAATGGSPDWVISPVDIEVAYLPSLLPDGDTVIYSVRMGARNFDQSQIVAQSLSTGERTVLIDGGHDVRYVPSGHLMYAFENTLFAVAFDPDTLTVSGGPVPVVEGVMRSPPPTGAANYAISEDGTLVYVSGELAADDRTLVWIGRDGREEPIERIPARAYTSPRISPDGLRVALSSRDEDVDIWVWDFVRETLTRLTFDPGQDRFAVWSPDSQQIFYSAQRGEQGVTNIGTTLARRAADGSGSEELLVSGDGQFFPTSFLPDGTGIVGYGTASNDAEDNIAIFSVEEASLTPLLDAEYNEAEVEISPDGRWLAYTSDESGRNEVYVRPFPNLDAGRWQVSRDGGTQALWSNDGTELFFRNEQALMAVSVETQPTFVAGNPQVLFEGNYANPQGGRSFDISPEGERFLMMKQDDSASAAQIVIVQNWFEELERLVPTD